MKDEPIDWLEYYKTANLHEKRDMFETILWNDVLIFNAEHKSLDDSNHVCFISTNGTKIQLTIHFTEESNVTREEE